MPPPPQLLEIPALTTINASHSSAPRGRRGARTPTSTIAGNINAQVEVENSHEAGTCRAAVVTRVMVSVAVVVVPAAPSVTVGGVNAQDSPGGRLAQESVSV